MRRKSRRDEGNSCWCRSPPRKFERYTPLNAPRAQILMEMIFEATIENEGASEQKRQKNVLQVSSDHGYGIEEYLRLKNEVKALIQHGHLNRYIND